MDLGSVEEEEEGLIGGGRKRVGLGERGIDSVDDAKYEAEELKLL